MSATHASSSAPRPVSSAGIFRAFLWLGVTAFGGPAVIAYIREGVVNKKRWVSDTSFQDGLALCQAIPGATGMQMAAYSGLRIGGLPGAFAAYLGFGLPAFILMIALSALYREFQQVHVVETLFHGLRAIVVAIVANALWTFGRASLKNPWDALLASAAAALLFSGSPPGTALLLVVALGLLVYRRPAQNGGPSAAEAPRTFESGPLLRTAAVLFTLGCLALLLLFVVSRPLFHLGLLMTKIDALAFGGGYASVPLMLHEVTEKRHWLDRLAFMDGIALGQVTPGPIVITGTFVGYQTHGLLGAIVATVYIFAPSFVILLAVLPSFDHLRQYPWFRRALRGAVVCFVGLLAFAVVKLAYAIPWGFPSILLASGAFLALRLDVGLPWVLLIGSLLTLVLF